MIKRRRIMGGTVHASKGDENEYIKNILYLEYLKRRDHLRNEA
jgi:hypothetical protein